MSNNHDIEKFRPGAGGSSSGMNPTGPLHGASAPRPNSLGRGHKKPHHKSKPNRPGRKSNMTNKPGTSRPNVRMPNSMNSSAPNNGSMGNLNGYNNRNSSYGNRNNSQNQQNRQNNDSARNNSRNGQGNFNPYNHNSQNSGNLDDQRNNKNRSQGQGLNNFNNNGSNNNSPNFSNNNSNNGYGSNNSNFNNGNNDHSSMGLDNYNNDNNDQGPSNQSLDDYANDDKDDKNSNSNDPNHDNLSDSNNDSSKDSNNPDSNHNDNQQGDPNDPNSKDNRDPNDTSDETDPNNKKKGNDHDKGLLGRLKGLLTGKKKKKSFGDFLKDEKKRQKENDQDNNDPAKKAKNLLQRILRLIRRIINLLRLYARAMRLFLMFKFVMMVQSIINWVLGMFNMVISFFISLWTAAVGFLGSIGASILAFLFGGFAIALVAALMAFVGWYSNQQALNNALQQYYNECIKGSDGNTEENSPNSGSSAANLIKGRTPFNIKVKNDKTKNYNKAARNVAQAVHDYLKNKKHFNVPASWLFAQMFAEEGPSINGGTVQPVVSKDFNLAGMSGGYHGKTGTGHAEGDGGYSHYDNWSEFAGDWASYLYKQVFTHKPKSVKDYLNMCIKAHYMSDWSTYYPAMQSGVAFYNNAGGAASATGGSAEEADNNDNHDIKCGRTDEDFSGGDIVKEAKKWLGWFHYSQPERMSLLSHWQHPEKDMKVDCSGFMWFVLKRCHVKVPSQPWATPFMESDARGSHKYLKQISRSEAGPGDIIICNTGSGSGNNGHTGILLQKWHGGNTKIIEMGGEPKPKYQIHVNIQTINYAFGSLFTDGRVTIARVVHGGKHSSGGGDTDLPKSEAAAKAKIAQAESGGNWNARNGKYVGKYQCDISYFKGKDWHNHKLQSEVADRYVQGRYGSWKNALKFRLAHDYY